MIRVYIGKAGDKRQILSTGHAGYGAYGEDIVCAAVSALVTSFAMWLEDKADREEISVEKMDVQDGFVNIIYEDPEGIANETMKMTRTGLEAIAEKYFSNISINGGEIIF